MGILSVQVTGVDNPMGFDYTAAHGFLPGVIEIECAPQLTIPGPIVTVRISDGLYSVTLTNCLVDYARLQITTSGHIERLWLYDRRWRWHRKGEISGTWNVRNISGGISAETDKNPQQLAVMAFQAMEEPNFTVSNLPNDPADRPFVAWECETPQDVLDWLCERAGCDMAPNWHTNDMVLVRLGQGTGLPSGNEQSVTFGITRGIVADAIKVCGGYSLHQNLFEREAVGLDLDGTFKPHADLSYNQAGELTGLGVEARFDPLSEEPDPVGELAKTVFRYYRIKGFSNGGTSNWVLPATGQYSGNRNALPPRRRTPVTGPIGPDGTVIEDPPYIEGVFLLGVDEDPDSLNNSEAHERLETPYTIDYETGIVRFSVPIVKLKDDADDAIEPAELYLMASHKVRDTNNGHAYARHSVRTDLGIGAGTPDYVIRRDDLIVRYITEYGPYNGTITQVLDNTTLIEAVMNSEIAGIIQSMQSKSSEMRRYAGIVPIALNGVIRQVRWKVQCGTHFRRGGAWTWGYANTEADPYTLKLHERRRIGYAEGDRPKRLRRQHSRYTRLRNRDRD